MKLTQAQLQRIRALESKGGRISAKRVLEDARKKSSPLHSLYDWNIKDAAYKWWLQRTRLIIASVTMQETTTHSVLKAPAYVVDTSTKGGGYRSVVALRDDKSQAVQSLLYTLETAAGHLRRAYDLAASLGLEHQIDDLLLQVASVQRVIEKKKAA